MHMGVLKESNKDKRSVKRLMNSFLGESPSDSPTSKWALVTALENISMEKSDFKLLAEYALSVGLTKKEYAHFLHINPRTLDRNMNDNYTLDLDKSEKILRISKMIQRGVDTFGNIEKFSKWIREYNTSLQKRPIELFTTIVGIELIENVLTRIDYGVYS